MSFGLAPMCTLLRTLTLVLAALPVIFLGSPGRQRALSSVLGLQPRLPHDVLRMIGHAYLLQRYSSISYSRSYSRPVTLA